MEFEDQEEEQEEEEEMDLLDSAPPSSRLMRMQGSGGETAAGGGLRSKGPPCRYRECMKNHAVGIGGHAVDGCCEFMPAGVDGTMDALKCAACNCHRNFHRKEPAEGEGTTATPPVVGYHHPHHHHHHQIISPSSYYRSPAAAGYLHMAAQPQMRPLALPSTSGGGVGNLSRGDDGEDVSNPSYGGGVVVMGSSGGTTSSKKRFRTKFTAEQKDRMLGLAERLGWRIQRHDEAVVQQFCDETGVKRHVLKVWMHNNKHTLGNKKSPGDGGCGGGGGGGATPPRLSN